MKPFQFKMPRKIALLIVLLLALGWGVMNRIGFLRTAVESYLYGYPLVAMDVTRQHFERFVAPRNVLFRLRQPADENFHEVVRPAVDLLYSSAFLDMNDGPFVYTMPANAGRYTLVPAIDAWSNVFSSIGTRVTGNSGASYLLVGPGWSGAVPPGMEIVRAPTRMVWIVARTQLNDDADLPHVHAVQDAIRFEPLSQWQQAQGQAGHAPLSPAPAPDLPGQPRPRDGTSPAKVMHDMRTADFFSRLTRLMVDNPPGPQDGPMIERMATIGLVPGREPDWGPLDRLTAALGRYLADRGVEKAQREKPVPDNGWWMPPMNIGNFGTDYHLRAGVAMVALAANVPADALYPTAVSDAQGHALHGDHTYRLHFAQGQLPPVRAFWSVTAYGDDAFLIPNPWHRYSIRSGDDLRFNADGSLDLYIGPELPAGVHERNWLPVQRGQGFQLTARLYWPLPAALDGRWAMPALDLMVDGPVAQVAR